MRIYPATNSRGEIHMVTVEEKSSLYYDTWYADRKNKAYSVTPCDSPIYPIWNKIVERIGDGERVMDLGCGTGQLANLLVSNGKQFVLGVDFSRVAIEKAMSMMPFGKFLVGDIYKRWVYDLVPYDCVVLSEVIEHLEQDMAVLGHIKEGAHVVFSVPNYLTSEGSHVRAFLSIFEVENRYGGIVRISGIDEVMMDKIENQKVWIVDGHKSREMV